MIVTLLLPRIHIGCCCQAVQMSTMHQVTVHGIYMGFTWVQSSSKSRGCPRLIQGSLIAVYLQQVGSQCLFCHTFASRHQWFQCHGLWLWCLRWQWPKQTTKGEIGSHRCQRWWDDRPANFDTEGPSKKHMKWRRTRRKDPSSSAVFPGPHVVGASPRQVQACSCAANHLQLSVCTISCNVVV